MKQIHSLAVGRAALIALAATFALASCGAKKEAYGASTANFVTMDDADIAYDEEMFMDEPSFTGGEAKAASREAPAPVPEPASAQKASSSYERKLIRTGQKLRRLHRKFRRRFQQRQLHGQDSQRTL